MKQRSKKLEQALNIVDRRELIENPDTWWQGFSVQNAQAVTKHLRSLPGATTTFHIGVIHSYTSDLLDPWLDMHASVHGILPTIFHAPYGFNILESAANSSLAKFNPQLTLFLLQREDLHPDLSRSISAQDSESRIRIAQETVERLLHNLSLFRKSLTGELIVSIFPSRTAPALGDYDAQADQSEQGWWAALRSTLAARFREQLDSATLFDDEQLIQQLGREHYFDARFWYSSKFPFTQHASSHFANRIITQVVLKTTPKVKVIVLDADNTIWGGIVGEDGPQGIALGPEYPGSAFMDFQRRLLEYQQRGVLLALCSKNNPQDVEEILAKHTHQLLRETHFAAQRVNWLPKSENIRTQFRHRFICFCG